MIVRVGRGVRASTIISDCATIVEDLAFAPSRMAYKGGWMTADASFGRWLSARRHLLDLTQEELARQVGCAVTTIRKLEADVRRPSKHVAERLAKSLEIAPAERPA